MHCEFPVCAVLSATACQVFRTMLLVACCMGACCTAALCPLCCNKKHSVDEARSQYVAVLQHVTLSASLAGAYAGHATSPTKLLHCTALPLLLPLLLSCIPCCCTPCGRALLCVALLLQLCAGAIRSKNTMNILLQTILDAAVSAIAWYLIG
jgi:hypothetical protein